MADLAKLAEKIRQAASWHSGPRRQFLHEIANELHPESATEESDAQWGAEAPQPTPVETEVAQQAPNAKTNTETVKKA